MRSPLLFLVLLIGCTGAPGKDDPEGEDTGDTADTDVHYDEGCITVDGGGGYANLADAVTVAPEGGIIELCDGDYTQAIIVDKAVTIRGASVDGTRLLGPGTDVPLSVTGTGVVLENLVIESARTGISLKSGSDSVLNQITVAAAGSWGVASQDATAVITGLTVIEAAAGAVQVAGGDVTIADSSIEYPGGYGIDISDQAVVDVTNTTITGTVMLSEDVSDGFAVQVDRATLTMTGSTIAGADGMGIYADSATVTVVDSTIQDAAYLAVYALSSTIDLSGVAISGSILQGIYATGPSFSMSASSVTASSEDSCSYLYEEWGSKYGPWCGGMLVAADVVSLTDVDVSGWNNYGWYLTPNEADLAAVTVTGGTIDDVGRWGAYFYSAEGTVSGLAVTNLREPELLPSEICGYVDRSVAMLGVYSSLAVDGLLVKDNMGWGFTSLVGDATVSGSTFDGNECWGFANYQSVGTVTGSTFTNGSANGGVYEQEGVLVLDGNTFTANSSGDSYEYDYGDYIYRSEYSTGQGNDVFAYTSGSVSVTNNTFSGGDTSVSVYLSSNVAITGNAWTDYEGALFLASDLLDTARFADNTADDVVGPVVNANSSDVDVENVQIGTTRASDLITVSTYYDDVLDSEYSYSSSASVFYAYGYFYEAGSTVTEEPAAMSIRDVTVTSVDDTLIYAYDASFDIAGLTVGSVGSYAVYGYWYGTDPDVEIDGLTVDSTGSSGVAVYNYSQTGYGAVALSNVHVGTAGGDGVAATAIGALDLTDVSFGSVVGDGVRTVSRSYDYVYEYADDGTYLGAHYVDLDGATAVTIDGLTIGAASDDGLALQGGSATIAGLAVSGASGDGVQAQGLTSLTIADTTLTSPAGGGVASTDSYSYYAYGSSTYVIADGNTAAALTGTTVTDAGSAAYAFDGGTVSLDGVSGTSAAASGLTLANVTADVEGNTFTGNDAYGMTCESVTLSTCAANDLTDNALGAHLDCSDSCAE